MRDLLNWLVGFCFAPDDPGGQTPPPANGDAPPPAAGQEPPPAGDGDGTQTLVDLMATDENGHRLYFDRRYVEELRGEAARLRTENQRLKTGGQTPPSEPDTPPPAPGDIAALNARIEALEAQTKRQAIENAVIAEAAKATEGRAAFIDPRDAVHLADLTSVTIGDDGAVTGVEAAIAKLAESKPHLLNQQRAPLQRVPNPSRESVLTLEEIQAMSPDEYLKRKDEVDAVLAQHGG